MRVESKNKPNKIYYLISTVGDIGYIVDVYILGRLVLSKGAKNKFIANNIIDNIDSVFFDINVY